MTDAKQLRRLASGSIPELANRSMSLDDVSGDISALVEKNSSLDAAMRTLTVDYLTRSSTMDVVVNPKRGRFGASGILELHVPPGMRIDSLLSQQAFERVDPKWKRSGQTWTARLDKAHVGTPLLVNLRGAISQDALDELVAVDAATNPERLPDRDRYWVTAGLLRPEILDDWFDRLSIDRVNMNVAVGVERQFMTGVPEDIRIWLEEQRAYMKAGTSRQRDIQIAKANLQRARRRVGKASIRGLMGLIDQLTGESVFGDYVSVDAPFDVNQIQPWASQQLLPEELSVGVESRLSLKQIAAEGKLTYEKAAFREEIRAGVDQIKKEGEL